MENYTILPVPYTVGPEAYNNIAEYTRLYGTKAVVIGGEKAMAASREKMLAAWKVRVRRFWISCFSERNVPSRRQRDWKSWKP